MLDALDGTVIAPERLWLFENGAGRPIHGPDQGWTLRLPDGPGPVDTPVGRRWLAPVPDEEGLWLEGDLAGDGISPSDRTRTSVEVVTHLLRVEREVARLSQELASRYEEIDLLYTISEVLGQTNKLEQAARTIVRAVSSVVGASRASIMVHDDEAGVLRTVAAQGLPPGRSGVIDVDDPTSIAARVFREQRPLIGEPGDNGWYSAGKEERAYQGLAFMSVPICYAAPGTPSRCIGVVNLTDRVGGDRFLAGDRKLVAAIANQIGAALENARLAERERRQERLDREMELASTLQESLLPSPAALGSDAEVGVRCVSLESVGGDFYGFNRLGGGSVSVMVGDVSSHGFAAALLMASAVVAAGIHIAAIDGPDRILAALRHSLAEKLAASESYLTIFLARIDPQHGRLVYANAGHPHAFRIPASGEPTRLEATAMPLGLGEDEIGSRAVPWVAHEDLLCVFTDGLIEATDADGERFGERRILEIVAARRHDHPDAIAATVMGEVERFAPVAQDDRTLLILRA